MTGDGSPADAANFDEMAADLTGDVEVTEGQGVPPKGAGLLT
jgi:hypothetical protein